MGGTLHPPGRLLPRGESQGPRRPCVRGAVPNTQGPGGGHSPGQVDPGKWGGGDGRPARDVKSEQRRAGDGGGTRPGLQGGLHPRHLLLPPPALEGPPFPPIPLPFPLPPPPIRGAAALPGGGSGRAGRGIKGAAPAAVSSLLLTRRPRLGPSGPERPRDQVSASRTRTLEAARPAGVTPSPGKAAAPSLGPPGRGTPAPGTARGFGSSGLLPAGLGPRPPVWLRVSVSEPWARDLGPPPRGLPWGGAGLGGVGGPSLRPSSVLGPPLPRRPRHRTARQAPHLRAVRVQLRPAGKTPRLAGTSGGAGPLPGPEGRGGRAGGGGAFGARGRDRAGQGGAGTRVAPTPHRCAPARPRRGCSRRRLHRAAEPGLPATPSPCLAAHTRPGTPRGALVEPLGPGLHCWQPHGAAACGAAGVRASRARPGGAGRTPAPTPRASREKGPSLWGGYPERRGLRSAELLYLAITQLWPGRPLARRLW